MLTYSSKCQRTHSGVGPWQYVQSFQVSSLWRTLEEDQKVGKSKEKGTRDYSYKFHLSL